MASPPRPSFHLPWSRRRHLTFPYFVIPAEECHPRTLARPRIRIQSPLPQTKNLTTNCEIFLTFNLKFCLLPFDFCILQPPLKLIPYSAAALVFIPDNFN